MAVPARENGTLTDTDDLTRPKSKPAQKRKKQHADQARLANVTGYRLRLAQLAVFRDFIESFEELDIKPVHYAMVQLIEANPGLRQGELARALGIKRANMVSLVNGLEDRGLIERRPVASDKRSYALHLTGDGEIFAERMQEIWYEHENRMVRYLGGEAEKQKLIELLDRIAGLP